MISFAGRTGWSQNSLAIWNLWSPQPPGLVEENEAQVPFFAIPVSHGLPIKVRICFDFDRKKKKKERKS